MEEKVFAIKDLAPAPYLISHKELIGYAVYEAMMCKTYPTLPRSVDVIVDKLTLLTTRTFKYISKDFYCREFRDYDALLYWLRANVMCIPEIRRLNLSDVEFRSGVQVEDKDRVNFNFTSSENRDAVPFDEDFVDLEAYVRNLCHDLIRSQIKVSFADECK